MANPNHRRLIAAIVQKGGGFAGLAGDANPYDDAGQWHAEVLPSGASPAVVAPSVIYASSTETSRILDAPSSYSAAPAPVVSKSLIYDPAAQPSAVGVPDLLKRPDPPPATAAGTMPSFWDTLFNMGRSPLAPTGVPTLLARQDAPAAAAKPNWLLWGAIAIAGVAVLGVLVKSNR